MRGKKFNSREQRGRSSRNEDTRGDRRPSRDNRERESFGGKRDSGSFRNREEGQSNNQDRYADLPERKPFFKDREDTNPGGEGRTSNNSGDRRQSDNRTGGGRGAGQNDRNDRPRFDSRTSSPDSRNRSDRPRFDSRPPREGSRDGGSDRPRFEDRSKRDDSRGGNASGSERPRFERDNRIGGRDASSKRPEQGAGSDDYRTSRSGKSYAGHKNFAIPKTNTSEIRLNKYIADCGVCTRREADTLIEAGAVEVNGVVITEMGKKVSPNDVVKYGGQTLSRTKAVYFVLNKPKNIDSRPTGGPGQKSVYDLMRGSTKERIAPVGELDRNTSGVLLFTNDGNMAKKLTHPRLKCHKIYHVTTEKSITSEHMALLKEGIELKDGIAKVDNIEYVDGSGKNREIGVEISSGKRKVVTRMLEQLGYKILKLDRVSFAGLNKKNVPRGKYRELSEKEVGFLRML